MNIGFDLDEIFVSHPPFIPASLIAFLYRGRPRKNLHYRMPGPLEKQLRILSHISFLRPILKENLTFIEMLAKTTNHKFHLISSRFSFLKGRTEAFINKNGFKKLFETIDFNYDDKQPHLFKSEILSRIHLDKYVDDDLPLLKYLASHHQDTIFYWLNKDVQKRLEKNLFAIRHIDQML